jgi:hypothetical protein
MAEGKPTAVFVAADYKRRLNAKRFELDDQVLLARSAGEDRRAGQDVSLDMQKEMSQAWKDYYRDLAALKDQEDPGGVKAAELSKRRFRTCSGVHRERTPR